jgi:D-alanine-D-alanine ligase-like ATP-grasp enzyme
MKPLAVLGTDRPTGRAGALGRDHGAIHSHGWPPGGGECGPASQAFAEYDAKDAKGGPDHNRRANLKPNIYYKAQDFALGADRVPGCRGASRADRHLSGTTGEESEPAGSGVNARPGPTETSSAPDSAARAGFSFDEPAAGMVEDAACDC